MNLAGIHARSTREVQRTVHLVSVALSASPAAGIPDLPGDGMKIQLHPAPEGDELSAFASEYPTWVLLSGFRELAEQVTSVLDEVFAVRTYWRLLELQSSQGSLTGADYLREVTEANRRFERLSLPDKFSWLEKRYSVTFDPVLVARISSIIAVRNCLVHRRGIVGDRDVDLTGQLTLQWMRLSLQATSDDGATREIAIRQRVEAGERLALHHGPAERSFHLGERISLDAQTFSDIAWTVPLLAHAASHALEGVARNLGIELSEPTASISTPEDAG